MGKVKQREDNFEEKRFAIIQMQKKIDFFNDQDTRVNFLLLNYSDKVESWSTNILQDNDTSCPSV